MADFVVEAAGVELEALSRREPATAGGGLLLKAFFAFLAPICAISGAIWVWFCLSAKG